MEMDDDDLVVVSLGIHDDGIELVVNDPGEQRRGIDVAHNYFVTFDSEEFGTSARDLLEEIMGFADSVHYGWKRAPKRKVDDE